MKIRWKRFVPLEVLAFLSTYSICRRELDDSRRSAAYTAWIDARTCR